VGCCRDRRQNTCPLLDALLSIQFVDFCTAEQVWAEGEKILVCNAEIVGRPEKRGCIALVGISIRLILSAEPMAHPSCFSPLSATFLTRDTHLILILSYELPTSSAPPSSPPECRRSAWSAHASHNFYGARGLAALRRCSVRDRCSESGDLHFLFWSISSASSMCWGGARDVRVCTLFPGRYRRLTVFEGVSA
jgi:hypothetical protein